MEGSALFGEAHGMQVPPDLASRIANLAVSSGRSPESFLREAISRLMEGAASSMERSTEIAASFGQAMPRQDGFQPQPLRFSVYE